MERILVTGATGRLGKLVVEQLLQLTDSGNIAVLVRDEEKAAVFEAKGIKVHIGDYEDYESLVNAFTGINKLYMVSGNDLDRRAVQHQNVIKAACDAGAKHIFYTSFQRVSENEASPVNFVMASHLAAEKEIMASGLTYTILKHGVYTNMLPIYLGQHLLEQQTIVFPAGQGKVSYATREDMAEAGAKMLTHEGTDYDNKSVEIAGSGALSFNDIADKLTELTGKTFQYVSPNLADFEKMLTAGGVPHVLARITCAFAACIANDELNCPDPTLAQILGREPESVGDFLLRTYPPAA